MQSTGMILAVLFIVTLAGCSDPMGKVTTLSQVELASDVETATLRPLPEPKGGGIFARIFRSGEPQSGDVSAEMGSANTGSSNTGSAQTASVQVDTAMAGPIGPLAFGDVVPACGVRGKELGTKVSQRAGYALYDSFPNSTAPRPHYVTGFKDGCPRKFMAAIALFSDAAAHELFRYERSNAGISYSATDEAYEQIKSRVCGVGRGAPCGAKLNRLSRKMAFITAYPDFGTNDEWANLLMHNKELVAHSTSRR